MNDGFRIWRRMAAVALSACVAAEAMAGDFGNPRAYQFADANEQAVRNSTMLLRQQVEAGAFRANYTYNTHIDRQINCNQNISATGNAAYPSNSGSGIAPVGVSGSGINANTTGNQSTTQDGAGVLNGPPGTTSVGQGVNGSSLGASVNGSGVSSQMGSINASGAQLLNTVSTEQTNSGSQLTAYASDSTACSMGNIP